MRRDKKNQQPEKNVSKRDKRKYIEYKQKNKKGITIVLVTHESDIAEYGNRTIHMKDGKIIKEEK